MEQLEQNQQLEQAEYNTVVREKQKQGITIHNPNTDEETVKYLASLILQGLKDKHPGGKL
ncbi:MAG: hypothetical protein ACK5JH_06285 [Anaerocolumna sp.]